jgi:hypothetical protein
MTNREFILPSQTAVISERDIERARDIRDAVIVAVESRRAYVEQNGVDPAFAYPDGIWSQDDGEVLVVEHYRALCRLDRKSLARMRGTLPFFTGHMLYEVRRGNEYKALLSQGVERRPFPSYTDEEVLENLVARNGAYVDRWEHITRGCRFDASMRRLIASARSANCGGASSSITTRWPIRSGSD